MDPSSSRPVWHGILNHTHHETQVPLPSYSQLPPPSPHLHSPYPPTEEHMSPISVLLSQHTIKAECQTLLPYTSLITLTLHMANSTSHESKS